MKQSFVKALIVTVLVLALSLGFAVSAFALPINNVSNSYFYDVNGNDASAPLAFTVDRVISYPDIVPNGTVKQPFEPVDLHYHDGYLYVLDAKNRCVYVLDDEYKLVTTISRLSGDNIPDIYVVQDGSSETEDGEEVPDLDAGSPEADAEAPTGPVVMTGGNKFELQGPMGIFVVTGDVDEDGDGKKDPVIYISDTDNQRIVVCNLKGQVSQVYQQIKVSVLGDLYSFKPTRLVVDNTGDLQVICSGINRGIMQINSDGEFRAFFGAPDVLISAWERLWRNFATEEQLAQMVTFTPTEYSSLTIDKRGFIYPTISALDDAAVKGLRALSISPSHSPVKKLSADGTDMLRRKGLANPMGDLVWAPSKEVSPKIIDISVQSDSGRYTILDQQTGRFFTYDADGNLLYLAGGKGTSQGTFQMPAALETQGDYVYISDTTAKTITVFRATDYVKAINEAAQASANGLWETSIPLWQEVLSYNSNMFIANIGLGKAEMRLAMALIDDQRDANGMNALDHYEKAIFYFDRASEKDNYSVAYTALRGNELEKYFGLIFGVIGVLIVGLIVLKIVRAQKKKKAAKAMKKRVDQGPMINRAKKGDAE
ncbi:MAG: hypothetical protein J6M34_05260 [Clostridia bacterium]|nr:hypothetical protein [Clostridia bacterium]